jgi:hypothetical protein
MQRNAVLACLALLVAGCANSPDVSTTPTSVASESTVEIKLDGNDCSVLTTITYDLESAIFDATASSDDDGALETMKQLQPVFEDLVTKYSSSAQSEAGMWLGQLAGDSKILTTELETDGILSTTEESSRLKANIRKLDEFCPSEE